MIDLESAGPGHDPVRVQGIWQGACRSATTRSVRPVALLAPLLLATAVFAAPAPGERYLVDGRCVTLTAVDAGLVSYAWSAADATGSGSLPDSELGRPCTEPAGATAQGDSPAGQPAPAGAADAAQADVPAGLTPFTFRLLQLHNRYRCMHGVPPLQWNKDVADYAQRWVNQAGFAHSDSYNTPIGPMGENLFSTTGVLRAEDAVADWYSESLGYDYDGDGAPGTGHFTAMIWKGARFLGCGSVGGTLMCNYWAGPGRNDCAVPNTTGCFTTQVLPVAVEARACR